MRKMIAALALTVAGSVAPAAEITVAPVEVTDWKPVYARVEARDRIPARARLGGTLIELAVSEGDQVEAGEVIGRIHDTKLEFRLRAIEARLESLRAQAANARTELQREERLLQRGVSTAQRVDALRTRVDVLDGQIASAEAEARVVRQQMAEGDVLAPITGKVLRVPLARGAVVMPGEAVAEIGGGGFFLRLAVPERHALALREGDPIPIETDSLAGTAREGRLSRIYPVIENGRVLADVSVPALEARFVDRRVLVRLPVARHEALLVPVTAVTSRGGLDRVHVRSEEGETLERIVVLGPRRVIDGQEMVEVLSGLAPGERVVTDDD